MKRWLKEETALHDLLYARSVTFSGLLPRFLLLKNPMLYSGVYLSRILAVGILVSTASPQGQAKVNTAVQKQMHIE